MIPILFPVIAAWKISALNLRCLTTLFDRVTFAGSVTEIPFTWNRHFDTLRVNKNVQYVLCMHKFISVTLSHERLTNTQ